MPGSDFLSGSGAASFRLAGKCGIQKVCLPRTNGGGGFNAHTVSCERH
jgi:hypothetical protein